MEYEEFDKRFGEIFYIFQIVVDFLIKKPVPVSDFRDELKKYVGSLDIVENFIKKYQERNIIEFQYNYDKKMTLVGLTKEYREKLRKQE